MIRSCSAWMVRTMSVIRPVRLAFSAASSTDSPARPDRSATSGASRSRVSSVIDTTVRPRVRMCRRRRTPRSCSGVAV